MNVTMLRQALERLEREGRGDSDLYVFPTGELLNASHRPGHGSVLGFDFQDFPIEGVNATFTRPEDATVIFIEFGALGSPSSRENPIPADSASKE